MLQNIATFISEYFKNIRFVDLIDILIVSSFLYTFITWFRRSASRRLISAAIILIIIYLLARVLGLFLTELLINVLAIFIALAAVIIFQSDIRRVVDLIGAWGTYHRRQKTKSFDSRNIDLLVEVSAKMAEKRTGAILAIKGKEPWDGVITGGIPLDGAISLPLIYSIFSTSSPGHDGAVLIEEERIVKFGAHLPLSKNLSEIDQGGTRHAAALGLSEQCDCIVIVISEERGTIKIAENGRYRSIFTATQLKEQLESFMQKNYIKHKETFSGLLKSGKAYTALISVLLSTVLWAIFAFQSESVYRTYTVPVEFRNLNPGLVLEEPVPEDCRITLAGSEQAFRLLNPSGLVVSLDVDKLDKGENEMMIAQDNIHLPSGLRLYNVEPRSVRIYTALLKFVKSPVKVQTMGRLPKHLKLLSMTSEPDTIVLRVPEKGTYEPRPVLTEPIDLSQVNSSRHISTRLIPPKNSRLLPEQVTEVSVYVKVSRK